MTTRIVSLLYDLADLLARRDITSLEKGRVLLALIGLKFSRGARVPFLGYSIAGDARANVIGILKEVFLKGDYSVILTGPTPRIIDAGANIGITTVFFKQQFPQSRITSFEAARKNFEFLKRNIEENHLTNVEIVFGALGLTAGTRKMFFNEKKPGGSTMHADVAASKTAQGFVEEEVPALRLSSYLTEDIDLLKLDVEGGEGEILTELDTSGTLKRVKQIVMEYHANDSNDSNALVPILELLEKNGFSIVIYDNEHGAYGKRLRKDPHYHFMIRAYR